MFYIVFVVITTLATRKLLLNHKKDILQKSFGLHVKRLRIKKGLTQVEVSSNMNKDQQSLQRIESGLVSPSLYYLFQLANGLDVTIHDLMDFEILDKKKGK